MSSFNFKLSHPFSSKGFYSLMAKNKVWWRPLWKFCLFLQRKSSFCWKYKTKGRSFRAVDKITKHYSGITFGGTFFMVICPQSLVPMAVNSLSLKYPRNVVMDEQRLQSLQFGKNKRWDQNFLSVYDAALLKQKCLLTFKFQSFIIVYSFLLLKTFTCKMLKLQGHFDWIETNGQTKCHGMIEVHSVKIDHKQHILTTTWNYLYLYVLELSFNASLVELCHYRSLHFICCVSGPTL